MIGGELILLFEVRMSLKITTFATLLLILTTEHYFLLNGNPYHVK
jgi:hypothetical protein